MSVHYMVDGYNLLHESPDLVALAKTDLESARNALVSTLANYQGLSGHRVSVVFDGAGQMSDSQRPSEGAGLIEVIYSSHHHSADSIIERAVYKARRSNSVIVVTNDNGIRSFCTGVGALVMGCSHFLDSMEAEGDEVSTRLDSSARRHASGNGMEDRLSEAEREHLKSIRSRLEK